jgi:hypothetical protein
MSDNKQNRRWLTRRLSREIILGAVAVGGVAFALSHPAVMSVTGLPFQPVKHRAVDTIPVGSIQDGRNAHALTGVIKGLRLGRD